MARAWQIADVFSIDGLKLNEVPEQTPGPGQVTVRIRGVSLNYRDLLVAKGLYSKKVPLPLTVCSDCAGEVAAVGAGVTRFKPGDRVAGCFMPGWIAGAVTEAAARSAMGAFAQGVLAESATLSEEAWVKLPAYLTWEEAASLPCAGVTAWNALVTEGEIKQGDTVLVQGSGGVSLFALQFARAAGAGVIAITSSEEKAARLRALGASEAIDYNATPDWEEAVRKLTGGGVDHAVEIGGAATIGKSIRATRMGGRIALIGNRASGQADVNLTAALMKAIRIQGIFVGSREMFEAMNRSLERNRIQPVVDSAFEFERAPDAFRHLDSARHFGKVCVTL